VPSWVHSGTATQTWHGHGDVACPNPRAIADNIKKVRAKLLEKTGYRLLSRPFNLLKDPELAYGAKNEILGIPNATFTKQKIEKIIDDAFKDKVIVDPNDTGFDIDPNTPLT
jgi:hypothetical protein